MSGDLSQTKCILKVTDFEESGIKYRNYYRPFIKLVWTTVPALCWALFQYFRTSECVKVPVRKNYSHFTTAKLHFLYS